MSVFMNNSFGSFPGLDTLGESFDSMFKKLSDMYSTVGKPDCATPACRAERNEDTETYYIDLPGCEKDAVDVSEQDGKIVVSATRTIGGESKYGLAIKPMFGTEAIECSYVNGVLTIATKKVEKPVTEKKFKVL